MEKRYAVIGLGRFGLSVAKVLTEVGQYVLAVDSDADRVDALAGQLPHLVRADTTDPAAVKALRIGEYGTVVVAIGDNVEASVITCLNCRDYGARTLIAKAQDEAHGRVLERLGVDRVVYPQREMGARVAHNLSAGGIIDFIPLSERIGMAEMEIPPGMVGQTLAQVNVAGRYGLNVLAIKRGSKLVISPGASERLEDSDVLVVIGEAGGIEHIQDA